jgi:hypothetical protein
MDRLDREQPVCWTGANAEHNPAQRAKAKNALLVNVVVMVVAIKLSDNVLE